MIPTAVRILVCTEPQDMRRSFDGLSAVVEHYVGADPRSGALFVFVNKRKNRLKVLWFDKSATASMASHAPTCVAARSSVAGLESRSTLTGDAQFRPSSYERLSFPPRTET